jgi:exopolysaccharide biosynthesis polyprenyl glycosylphosphotransferase
VTQGAVKEIPKEAQLAAPVPISRTRDVRARQTPLVRGLVRSDMLRSLLRVVVLAILDAAGIVLAIWTALEIKRLAQFGSEGSALGEALEVAPLACLVTILLFARSRLYGDRSVRPGFARVVGSLFQVMVVTLVYALVQGEHFSSYYIFYGSLIFALAYVSVFRWLFERASGALLRAGGYKRRAVLVGSADRIEAVAGALENGQSPIDAVGFVSLTPHRENGLENFGELDELDAKLGRVDEVLIVDPDFPQDAAVDLLDRCRRHRVRLRVAPSTMEILMDRVEFVPGQTLPLFEVKPPVFDGFDFILKRGFDLLMAAILSVFLLPLMALIALAIRLTSPGPVLYRSIRPGIGGRSFACLKFRTMHRDADMRQEELEERNEKRGPIFKIRDDPRITPLGRFLRRWSLDELPQLWNVLRGEMSLVGPRPLTQRDYDRLEEWHRRRYLVLPGITGLWQVSGRSELDFDELVQLDFLYLERWSIGLDLSILLKTMPAVVRMHGAW